MSHVSIGMSVLAALSQTPRLLEGARQIAGGDLVRFDEWLEELLDTAADLQAALAREADMLLTTK